MTRDEKPDSVFAPHMDPCDIYLPMDVTGELMRCAASNGRISYEYLLAIYRKGKADAVRALASATKKQLTDESVQSLVDALTSDAALRSRPAPPDDGSVMVRVDPAYVEQMRGEGLAGPFSRITLDERDGVPTLLLTTEPKPTPDTVDYWRSVAQELATEIHKLRGLAAPMETR